MLGTCSTVSSPKTQENNPGLESCTHKIKLDGFSVQLEDVISVSWVIFMFKQTNLDSDWVWRRSWKWMLWFVRDNGQHLRLLSRNCGRVYRDWRFSKHRSFWRVALSEICALRVRIANSSASELKLQFNEWNFGKWSFNCKMTCVLKYFDFVTDYWSNGLTKFTPKCRFFVFWTRFVWRYVKYDFYNEHSYSVLTVEVQTSKVQRDCIGIEFVKCYKESFITIVFTNASRDGLRTHR